MLTDSTILLIVASLFILSFALTFLVRKVAIKKNVVDIPNERSSHTIPTPRGGGLAIVISWFIGLTILFITHNIEARLFYALLSGVFLAIISIIDDVTNLTPKIRLVAQALSAFLGLYFLKGFNIHLFAELPVVFNLIVNIVAFIGIIWFINLYNFLDGIDAYASLESIFIGIALFAFTGNYITLILIFPTLGFLMWNWPKAKIFMGDVGSTQLGYILIILGIYFHNTLELNFLYWLSLSGIFWFDATYTLFRRWRNKEKLSVAHKKHAYQRLNQSGFSHLKVNLYALGINLLILLIAYITISLKLNSIFSFALTLLVLILAMSFVNKRFPFPGDQN